MKVISFTEIKGGGKGVAFHPEPTEQALLQQVRGSGHSPSPVSSVLETRNVVLVSKVIPVSDSRPDI